MQRYNIIEIVSAALCTGNGSEEEKENLKNLLHDDKELYAEYITQQIIKDLLIEKCCRKSAPRYLRERIYSGIKGINENPD